MRIKKFLIGVVVVLTLFFLIQSAMISYMLWSGSVRPGELMFGDGIAPSYAESYISTFVSFLVLLAMTYLNYRLDSAVGEKRN